MLIILTLSSFPSSTPLLSLFSPPPLPLPPLPPSSSFSSLTLTLLPPVDLTPPELYLHLDVAVYYFFLQLYALFPCGLTTYLRGRYGPTGEVNEFQEYIAVSLDCGDLLVCCCEHL